MATIADIGFRKSIYYALNTAPILKHCKAKQGGWIDRKLNSVLGFNSQAERIQFLQTANPEDVSLSGSAFANFNLVMLGTAISVLGTGLWRLDQGRDLVTRGGWGDCLLFISLHILGNWRIGGDSGPRRFF